MAQSSDELIKNEISEKVGSVGKTKLRIFPGSSNNDQKLFSSGGLTFGSNNVSYGSCDAVWYVDDAWFDPYDDKTYDKKPVIALEGTDALNRNSTGDAQYQRFHHALGAVKNGITGIYYLRKGTAKIQADLYEMACHASSLEKGNYLITDDLQLVKDLLEAYDTPRFDELVKKQLDAMHEIFLAKFNVMYKGDWNLFASKRSTIIQKERVIKYAGRMRRNFTDSSQRAGHIAVGEMFLTKYFFLGKRVIYLFLKTTREELISLDTSKAVDKEWYLLRNEPDVEIKALDDIVNLDKAIYDKMIAIKDLPLKNDALRTYNICKKLIVAGLQSGKYTIK